MFVAVAVFVTVGVALGGVNENEVGDGMGVKVGASVALGDWIGVGGGVHVGSSPKGVMVGVGD